MKDYVGVEVNDLMKFRRDFEYEMRMMRSFMKEFRINDLKFRFSKRLNELENLMIGFDEMIND